MTLLNQKSTKFARKFAIFGTFSDSEMTKTV